MRNIFAKLRIVFGSLVLLGTVACGGELPIQEMDQAKTQIARADSLFASEYAPEELSEAKKNLFRAHEQASEEKAGDAKKSAEYATSKANDALEKTLPKLAAKTRDEATIALDQADNAYATGLASAQFDRAISLRKEGDHSSEQGDQALGEFLQEKDEAKKTVLRQVAFGHYENSYYKYLESKKSAEQARDAALAARSELRQSARYVEEDLNTAETYLGGPTDGTRKEREALASAYQDIDQGDLKKANEKIQNSRSNARSLLAASIQNYARERNMTATEVVEDANARFEELKEGDLQKDAELRVGYESARENLGAANESLASAGNLYSQEKYEDSIRQSEEAIRLSEIVIEETAKLTPESIAKRGGTVGEDDSSAQSQTTQSQTTKVAGSKELKEGWAKYKVRSTKPEDCLWRIAEKKEYYGNAKLWPRIYQANKAKIKNKNLIYPNQVLYIPPKSGQITSPYKTGSAQAPKQNTTNLPDEKDSDEEEQDSLGEKETQDETDGGNLDVDNGSKKVAPQKSVNGPEEEEKTETEEGEPEEELLEEEP